ncbi:unnamed protein product [Candidula unifasciata]|uniref:Uncharacterized protein n=1 Tax=Candidula unifasciata TaxID=100452 RepID=A0A8S3ZJS5_9EUPU|nr:unnamed protein product [Candidula unifasciata]
MRLKRKLLDASSMNRQRKLGQQETGCFEKVYESLETLFLFTVYVAANCTACYIDPESGAMMLAPSTLLLRRARIVNTAFFVCMILASFTYLLLNKMDAFFIVLVHGLFLGVVTWQNAAVTAPYKEDD